MQSLSPQLLATLGALVGPDRVSTTLPDRDAYSRDLWPRSQLDRLAALPPRRPAAVVWPGDVEAVAVVVRACAEARVPIVPFGAGSGVCGGTLPTRGGVVVDLKRLKRIRSLDEDARTLEVEAGVIGERLERILESRGWTLGHFPSSILCSTVGGWVAGRSAGQCSSRYGKIEDMVLSLEVVTGDGEIRQTPRRDGHAGGLDWNQVFIGSEGTLGLITAVTLRIHPQPAARAFRGWMMPTVEAGLAAMRGAMQSGHRPAVLRLYDPLDTLMVGADPQAPVGGPLAVLKLALGSGGPEGAGGATEPPGLGKRLARRGLRLALAHPRPITRLISTLPERSLLVTVSEGQAGEAESADAALADAARTAGGVDLGEGPGRAWLAHRYDVSYKQSRLYAAGAFVDTFEVATTWPQVGPLYEQMRRALSPWVVVMAHFSHAYVGGCSIYFTLAGSGADVADMGQRYDAAWKAGLDLAARAGAAVAHHHGAGLSRASHLPGAHGEARRWFDALKRTLDPSGVLNPDKLFGEAP